MADNDSMYNTPPTFAIYVCGEVCKWIQEQGGVLRMEELSITKSSLVYEFLEQVDLTFVYFSIQCISKFPWTRNIGQG